MSHPHQLLLAIFALFLFGTGSANAADCHHSTKLVKSCCRQNSADWAPHNCCKTESASDLGSSSVMADCLCKSFPTQAVPVAFTLKLLPDQPETKLFNVGCSLKLCRLLASAEHYEPPGLHRPREKIYLITRSLLI